MPNANFSIRPLAVALSAVHGDCPSVTNHNSQSESRIPLSMCAIWCASLPPFVFFLGLPDPAALPLPISEWLSSWWPKRIVQLGISRMGHGIRRLGCLRASHRRTGSSAAAHSQQRRGTWLPTKSANPTAGLTCLRMNPLVENPTPPHSRAMV